MIYRRWLILTFLLNEYDSLWPSRHRTFQVSTSCKRKLVPAVSSGCILSKQKMVHIRAGYRTAYRRISSFWPLPLPLFYLLPPTMESAPLRMGVTDPKTHPKTLPFFPIRRAPDWTLPTFDGKSTSWNSFWQLFDHAISALKLPGVHNYIYLMGQLQGEAKALV